MKEKKTGHEYITISLGCKDSIKSLEETDGENIMKQKLKNNALFKKTSHFPRNVR